MRRENRDKIEEINKRKKQHVSEKINEKEIKNTAREKK